MRNPALAISMCLTLIVVASVGSVLVRPAAAQEDQMILGPRQLEKDTSGAGAVLCSWSFYVYTQAMTAACALPRRPVDDTIDQAIAAIDEFILANSSLHPTQAMLENFKRDLRQQVQRAPRRLLNCEEPFLGSSDESIGQIQDHVKKLLTIPREPVANPCN
jgi:hypothetical protein